MTNSRPLVAPRPFSVELPEAEDRHHVDRPRSVPPHLSSSFGMDVSVKLAGPDIEDVSDQRQQDSTSQAKSSTPAPGLFRTRLLRQKPRSSSSSNFYIPEGSDAPVKSGDEIRKMIDPNFKIKHQKEVRLDR